MNSAVQSIQRREGRAITAISSKIVLIVDLIDNWSLGSTSIFHAALCCYGQDTNGMFLRCHGEASYHNRAWQNLFNKL
jgi:hypothetical protein